MAQASHIGSNPFGLVEHIQRKYLGKIQPKIHDKIKEYYLRKYIEKWYENTIGDAQRKKELLANWLKNKFTQDKINREKRLKELLTRFLRRKDNGKLLLLAYGFYKFRKNAKLDQQIEYAKVIQEFCRKVLDKVIRNKFEKQKQLMDLLNRLYRGKFLKDLTDLAKKTNTMKTLN